VVDTRERCGPPMLGDVSVEPSDGPALSGAEPGARRSSWLSTKRPSGGEGLGALDVDDVVDDSWLGGASRAGAQSSMSESRVSESRVSESRVSTTSGAARFADPVSSTRQSDALPLPPRGVGPSKDRGIGLVVGEPAEGGSVRSSLRDRLGVRARGPRRVEVPTAPSTSPRRRSPPAAPGDVGTAVRSRVAAEAKAGGSVAGPKGSAAPAARSRRRARPRVRRVTRVLRRVDAWSVFKVSVIFWITMYLVMMMAGVLLWSVMASTGTLDNLESFITKTFALDSFAFNGRKIFEASSLLGLVLVVAATAATVTMAVFFNLISDLTGGVRLTVLEEEIQRVEPQAWSDAGASKPSKRP
jgi:hypothetical protein